MGWGDEIWWLFLRDLEGSRPELFPEQSIKEENYICDESSVWLIESHLNRTTFITNLVEFSIVSGIINN